MWCEHQPPVTRLAGSVRQVLLLNVLMHKAVSSRPRFTQVDGQKPHWAPVCEQRNVCERCAVSACPHAVACPSCQLPATSCAHCTSSPVQPPETGHLPVRLRVMLPFTSLIPCPMLPWW